jgi:hypothetical protein
MAKDTYIQDDLLNEIEAYCELNGLKPAILIDVWVREGFMKHKWYPIAGKNVGSLTGDEEPGEIKKNELTIPKKEETKPKNTDLYGE